MDPWTAFLWLVVGGFALILALFIVAFIIVIRQKMNQPDNLSDAVYTRLMNEINGDGK